MTELRITKEELTYERRGPRSRRSYFRDLAARDADPKANARLEAHEAEARVELPKMEARMARAAGAEYRVNESAATSAAAVPLWANQYFATAPRPKRVLASLIPTFDLPEHVASVHMPRIVTGTNTGTQEIAPVPDRDFTDAAVESPVTTVSGQSDVAMQLLEQSPLGAALDMAILKDLQESADANLEEKLFNGSGTGREITGILNLPTGAGAVSKVEYTSASPKGYETITELGKVGAQLGNARLCPPECWIMRTNRWMWIGSSTDLEDLPLAVPGHQALPPVPYTFDENRPAAAPPILGAPTFLSDAISTTLGEAKNQDAIFAIRPTDQMLFQGDTKTMVLTEVLSGTGQARFSSRTYAAMLWRRPTAISYLVGTGLVKPNEY